MTDDASATKSEDVVPLEEATEQVRRVCERLGLLHYAFAKTLVDEMGDDRGRQVAMNAIKLYSRVIGERAREKARAQASCASPGST